MGGGRHLTAGTSARVRPSSCVSTATFATTTLLPAGFQGLLLLRVEQPC